MRRSKLDLPPFKAPSKGVRVRKLRLTATLRPRQSARRRPPRRASARPSRRATGLGGRKRRALRYVIRGAAKPLAQAIERGPGHPPLVLFQQPGFDVRWPLALLQQPAGDLADDFGLTAKHLACKPLKLQPQQGPFPQPRGSRTQPRCSSVAGTPPGRAPRRAPPAGPGPAWFPVVPSSVPHRKGGGRSPRRPPSCQLVMPP